MKVQNVSGASIDYTHRTEHDIRSVGVSLHTYNTHATYQTMSLCSLRILKQVLRSMSHILERRKEYLGSADMYSFKCVTPLETIPKIRAVHYTCYPNKVLTSC